ncbi:Vacuolar protein sorting-associated protein 11 -like protein, partial [Trichinella spiralis]
MTSKTGRMLSRLGTHRPITGAQSTQRIFSKATQNRNSTLQRTAELKLSGCHYEGSCKIYTSKQPKCTDINANYVRALNFYTFKMSQQNQNSFIQTFPLPPRPLNSNGNNLDANYGYPQGIGQSSVSSPIQSLVNSFGSRREVPSPSPASVSESTNVAPGKTTQADESQQEHHAEREAWSAQGSKAFTVNPFFAFSMSQILQSNDESGPLALCIIGRDFTREVINRTCDICGALKSLQLPTAPEAVKQHQDKLQRINESLKQVNIILERLEVIDRKIADYRKELLPADAEDHLKDLVTYDGKNEWLRKLTEERKSREVFTQTKQQYDEVKKELEKHAPSCSARSFNFCSLKLTQFDPREFGLCLKPYIANSDDIHIPFRRPFFSCTNSLIYPDYNSYFIPIIRNLSSKKSKNDSVSESLVKRRVSFNFSAVYSQVVNQSSSTEKSPTHYFERGKPNWDQLQHVIYRLSETVPTFFLRRLDYTFYSDDVLFLNRICGSEVKGLRNYWLHLATLSVLSRIPCPYIEMKVLNCMPIVEEGSVHLRWRVLYLTVPEFLYVVVRERSADIETLRKNARWFDGFSHFYVGSDGLVYKHVADRVMRDPEEIAANSKRVGLLNRLLGSSARSPIWKQFNLDKEKKNLVDSYGLSIQLILATLAFASLIVKRLLEPKQTRRPWTIWFFDTSKQAVGSSVIHAMNIFLAGVFRGDPCTWYFVSFLLDSTLGLLIIYTGVKLVTAVASCRKDWSTLRFGEYGDPPQCRPWLHQCLAFVILSVIEKFFVTLLLLMRFWKSVREIALSPIRNPKVEVTLVILVFPFLINTIMFWVVDNFTMKRRAVSKKFNSNNSNNLIITNNGSSSSGIRRVHDESAVKLLDEYDNNSQQNDALTLFPADNILQHRNSSALAGIFVFFIHFNSDRESSTIIMASSLFQSWRRLVFFDRQLIADVENADESFTEFKDLNIACVAWKSNRVFIGEVVGGVHMYDKDFNDTYFKAYKVNLSLLYCPRSSDSLVSIGEDDNGVNPYLKVWLLDKLDKQGKPFAVRCSKTSPGNRPVKVTSVAVDSSGQLMVVGFEDSSILLYRGDVCKEKQPKSQLIRDGSTCASEGSIVGMELCDHSSQAVILYVVTTRFTFSFTISFKEKDITKTVLEMEGLHMRRCWALAGEELKNQFVVARNMGFYFYQPEEKGGCQIFRGNKKILLSHGPYLIVVSELSVNNEINDDKVTLTVYDMQNSFIAYEASFPDISEVFIAWNFIFILCMESGKLFRLKEMSIESQLDILFRKNLFDLAIKVSERNNVSKRELSNIYQFYGDYFYKKRDYSNALKQYMRTIGTLDTSYVIRKLLDAHRIENLAEYLEAVFHAKLGTVDHSNVLLSCYIKMNAIDKINSFIQNKETVAPLDVEAAVKLFRKFGLYRQAAFLTKRHGYPKRCLDLLVSDLKDFKQAINYISSLESDVIAEFFTRYSKLLLENVPEETMALLGENCSVVLRLIAHPDRLEAFLEQSLMVITFHCSSFSYSVFTRLVDCYSAICEQANKVDVKLYNLLLYAYLRRYSSTTENNAAKEQISRKIDQLLKNISSDNQSLLEALRFCYQWAYHPGILYLLERQKMYSHLLKHHMFLKDYDSVISACLKYGDRKSGDRTLWSFALQYFSEDPTISEEYDFLSHWVDKESQSIEMDEQDSLRLCNEIKRTEAIIDDIQKNPQIFQMSKCTACDIILETPTVHFLCKHSYHQHCFENYAESEAECPVCLLDKKRFQNQCKTDSSTSSEALNHSFKEELLNTNNVIGTLTSYFGKTLFPDKDADAENCEIHQQDTSKSVQSLNPFEATT